MTTNHASMMDELSEQYAPVLENSPDGVYLWLDEENKTCNQNLAKLFGYTVDEWVAVPSFLETFIAPDDQEAYAWNYQTRVGRLAYPVTFRFRGVRKDGSTFAAETDMIPVSWRGHAVAYHFVRRVGD